MFDQDTFDARHGKRELAADPILAMLTERKRLCDLAAETLIAAEKIELALSEKIRSGMSVPFDHLAPFSGCEALFREADALYRRADALDEQICRTRATSVAGILGQLERVREALQLQEEREELVDIIIAGVKALAAASTGSEADFRRTARL
jgi:hypothetical protein